MYIKMNADKSLIITVPTTIYQGETNADLITFLLPFNYEGHDITACTVKMSYIPAGGVEHSEELVCLPEMHNHYLQYSTPIDTRFTAEEGIITVWLTSYDADNNVIFKTSKVLIVVGSRQAHSDSDSGSGGSGGSGGGTGCNCDIQTTGPTDALSSLAECGILTPAYQDGTFYTDASGAIYVL